MDNIIDENSNLIYSIVNYFNGYKSKEDLYQVGCIGLIKAYKKFNPYAGVKFSTYAYPFIMGEIKKYIREDRGIKVGRDVSSLNGKIEKIKNYLLQQLMREPTIEEIADYLGVAVEDVNNAINSVNCLESFDYTLSNDGKELTLYDLIGSNMDIDTMLEIEEQLKLLSVEDRQIILSRYMEDLTQQETAKKLGINQVQVSRKEQKVLKLLRNKLTVM